MSRVRCAALPTLALAVAAVCAADASAFTVKAKDEAPAHEIITVAAAQRAGMGEPARNEITREETACSDCDRYGTDNLRTWSAVLGNRWAELHGWHLVNQTACFAATTQETEHAQYTHFLRGHCDSGPIGLRHAVERSVARIRGWFERAVMAADELTWVNDGGYRVTRVRVSRPYFLLGLALHTLQDSFGEEHVDRDQGFQRIRDVKTFLDTPDAQAHSKLELPAREDGRKDDIVRRRHATDAGDHAFTGNVAELGALRPAALAALAASADLIRSFHAARRAPKQMASLFRALEDRWLRYLPSHVGLAGKNAAPWCKPRFAQEESTRKACLAKVGAEPMDPGLPRFCWPASTCGEGGASEAAVARKAP